VCRSLLARQVSGGSAQDAVADVGDQRCGSGAEDLELQRRYFGEEAFAGTQRDWCNVNAQFVDETGTKVLVHRSGPTRDGDVAITGRRPCLVEGGKGCRRSRT
jgi:hypothetical protein